ncbi:Co-chaperone Hsc20 [Xylaria sp. FL1777]|nr:Co-chaperone Hsc20 [Xylaria sp. FL1777]
MRSSIFPARQMRRVCAFCRHQHQQQRQRHITTTRNLHTSSTHQKGSSSSHPLASSQPQSYRSPHSSTATPHQRPFSSTQQPSPSPSSSPSSSSSATATTTTTTTSNNNNNNSNNSNNSNKPQAPQTHYDFFPSTLPSGPPPRGRFEIDVRALRREFLSLQAGAHPDLHAAEHKARAQATSARINEAFRTLADPLLRAQHVLSLRGVVGGGGDGGGSVEEETARVDDAGLLMLVLETRERIEEARDEADLVELRDENEARVRDCVDRLGALFAEDRLEEARDEVVRLRYWVNVRESIDNWEKGKPVVLEH